MSGLMSMTGEPDRKPSRVGASTIDIGTGIYAAFAIWPALRHAERTGEGQKVEASLIDTAATFMAQWYTYYDMVGRVPQRQGHTWEAYAPSGVIETATGPVYVATAFQHLWERLCDSIGREDWKEDPRFRTNDDRLENRDALYAEMDEEFSNYERDVLLERLHDGGVPASEVQTVGQAAHDPHLHERGTIQEVEDVDGEGVLATSTPALLSATPASIESGPPQTGEHTRELLAERGYDETAIEDLVDAGVVEASD
jgi:crotonobetainyl-CoA:carnitine CoA-transferase CaiB-like acyl-CoA transferase